MNFAELLAFIIYFALVLGIGLYFFRKSSGGDDKEYFLGGRAMGPWVTAMSAQASDMSGWLLMGFPGSLIAFETGTAVAYGIFNVQDRGTMFITPGTEVYAGMVVGQNPKGEDISVNVCKTKHLTNTRASGSDDALRLVPISPLSLEGSLEFLAPDELLEVTPEHLRIRKRVLNHELRMKAYGKKKNG